MRTSLNDNHLAKYFTEHPNTGSMKTHICNVNKGVCLHMGNKKKNSIMLPYTPAVKIAADQSTLSETQHSSRAFGSDFSETQ